VTTITVSPGVARTALIGLRGGFAAGWVAPAKLIGLFGIDAASQPDLPYLMRLFAVREAALAFLTAASRGPARTLVLKTGVVVDTLDAVAAVRAGTSKKSPAKAAALATAAAAAAAALGVAALRD